MKTKTPKLMMVALGVLLSLNANAYDVQIDGIYYNLVPKAKIAEVTYGDIKYTRDISIPSSFDYNGTTYNVTSIGASAFDYCSGLISVNIPSSVTTIGDYAFRGCSSLTSVHISDLAAWCNIKFSNNPLSVAHRLYLNGEEVTDLTIPDGVTSIGASAFSGYSCLTSVSIPNSVTSIGSSAFYGCSGLTSVNISNSVTSICSHTFYGCCGLISVNIPNSVTSIGEGAFRECSGLISVNIPNSVTSIGEGAFRECSGLISVNIPNSVTSIGWTAFMDCSSMTSVTIPNSVTSIAVSAFSGCNSLTSVTIGNGIRTIQSRAFQSCPELADIYCLAENVPQNLYSYYPSSQDNLDMFLGSYIEYATLHVPAASIDAYKLTEPWSGFGKIVALEGETPETPKCATPTIAYSNGKLTCVCTTEGAECVTNIADADIKTHYGNEVDLTVTYNVSVYAMAAGYDNSETVTATLCWIDSDPRTEGIANKVAEVEARPVLIQSHNGVLTITGETGNEAVPVSVYNMAGVQTGSATLKDGTATINTNLTNGETAIVKIGKRAIKVLVK